MKPSLAALFVLSVASLGQEPSAKELREVLHADVKQYANDGRIVASWSLTNPDQLKAFDLNSAETVKLVPGEGLAFDAAPERDATLLFKELELRQPCRITFEVRLEAGESGFFASLLDQGLAEDRLNVCLNSPCYGDRPDRHDYVSRAKKEQTHGEPSAVVSTVGPRVWTTVAIELKKDRVCLSLGKTERCALADVPYKHFALMLGSIQGKATLRNLAIDGQVDRDSMRKLFRSVTASAESRPEGGSADEFGTSAWEALVKEMGRGLMDAAAMDELTSLPLAVVKPVFDSMKAMAEGADNLSQTRREIDAALQHAPKSGVLFWLSGTIALVEGETAKAVGCFEQSVQANPRLRIAWVSLGVVLGRTGKSEAGLAALSKAEELDPKDPGVHVWRARVHFETNRLDEGRKEIDRALAKKPESAGLKLFAKCLAKLGSRPEWKTTYTKENGLYVVETSISGKLAADLAERLIRYRKHLEQAFPLSVKQAAPSRVWVFDSEAEYHLFAGSLTQSHEQSLGLYHPLIKTLLLTSKVSDERTQHILFHEAFHQYLDLAVADPPAWLNEGLADYYGPTTFDVSHRPIEGGLVPERLTSLRNEKLLPLRTLAGLSQDEFTNPKGLYLHYAQAWAFVHFCKRGGNAAAAKLFDFYCTAIIAGKSPEVAFELSFGRDGGAELAAIETDFRTYVATRLLGGK